MFDEVEIKAIESGAAVCNFASYKLMEKLGFKRRGNRTHQEKYTFIDEPVDCYSYGITKENIKH